MSRHRIVDASDTEVVINQVSDLSSSKESVLFLSLLFLQTDSFLEVGTIDNFAQPWCNTRVEQLKVEKRNNPWIEHQDFKSSTDLAISTSLIHNMAFVVKLEQEHTPTLNLILQHEKVCGIGNLSKWSSEIWSLCWSAPWFLKFLQCMGWNEFPADGLRGNLGVELCLCPDHSFQLRVAPFFVAQELSPQLCHQMTGLFSSKMPKSRQVNLQKRFPTCRAFSKYQAANFQSG